MRYPRDEAHKKLERIIKQDADLSKWWKGECELELRRLAYSKEEDFKVAQGRVQAMLELADVLDSIERSTK